MMQFKRQLSPAVKLLRKIMFVHEYTSNPQGKILGFCLAWIYFCGYVFTYILKSLLAIDRFGGFLGGAVGLFYFGIFVSVDAKQRISLDQTKIPAVILFLGLWLLYFSCLETKKVKEHWPFPVQSLPWFSLLHRHPHIHWNVAWLLVSLKWKMDLYITRSDTLTFYFKFSKNSLNIIFKTEIGNLHVNKRCTAAPWEIYLKFTAAKIGSLLNVNWVYLCSFVGSAHSSQVLCAAHHVVTCRTGALHRYDRWGVLMNHGITE